MKEQGTKGESTQVISEVRDAIRTRRALQRPLFSNFQNAKDGYELLDVYYEAVIRERRDVVDAVGSPDQLATCIEQSEQYIASHPEILQALSSKHLSPTRFIKAAAGSHLMLLTEEIFAQQLGRKEGYAKECLVAVAGGESVTLSQFTATKLSQSREKLLPLESNTDVPKLISTSLDKNTVTDIFLLACAAGVMFDQNSVNICLVVPRSDIFSHSYFEINRTMLITFGQQPADDTLSYGKIQAVGSIIHEATHAIQPDLLVMVRELEAFLQTERRLSSLEQVLNRIGRENIFRPLVENIQKVNHKEKDHANELVQLAKSYQFEYVSLADHNVQRRMRENNEYMIKKLQSVGIESVLLDK